MAIHVNSARATKMLAKYYYLMNHYNYFKHFLVLMGSWDLTAFLLPDTQTLDCYHSLYVKFHYLNCCSSWQVVKADSPDTAIRSTNLVSMSTLNQNVLMRMRILYSLVKQLI